MRFIGLVIALVVFCGIAAAQNRMTDRESDGLKGNVKSVMTYDSDLETKNGKMVQTERKLNFSEDYDQSGNMTQSSLYVIGVRNIYKSVDGDKTSKRENFEVPGRRGGFFNAAPAREEKLVPRDNRYDDRFKFEYDPKGRIVEERRYGNEGSLNSRWTYRYDDKGNVVEEVAYDGRLVTDRELSTFDSQGNVIERKFIPVDTSKGDTETTHRFKDHKSDKQGNWIQRRQTTIYSKNGKTIQLESIYFREITYFD